MSERTIPGWPTSLRRPLGPGKLELGHPLTAGDVKAEPLTMLALTADAEAGSEEPTLHRTEFGNQAPV